MPEMFLARVPGTRRGAAWGLSGTGTNAQPVLHPLPFQRWEIVLADNSAGKQAAAAS